METHFVAQPFAGYRNLADFLEHVKDEGFDELRIATAWAKRSGLGRVCDVLQEFRDSGGKVILIVGVSEGGATKEGLELAREVADEAYVFHDPRRTFHPKVYYATAQTGSSSVLIGSSNLTAGGLSWNYEASVWIDLGPGENDSLVADIEAWFAKLLDEDDSCTPLTGKLIKDLEASADITIGTEIRSRRVPEKAMATPEDNDSAVTAAISGLFKAIRKGLRSLPPLSPRFNQPHSTPAAPKPTSVQPPTHAGAAPLPLHDVKRRWYKQMDHTAAQQPKSPGTKPTGNLRLSRESMKIDHTRYFREDFFAGLPWSPDTNNPDKQVVELAFNTWVDGQDLGFVDIRLSHDPHRISGQGNVPSVLHWGHLGRVLRGTDYRDFFVNLEVTVSGEYRLIISEHPRGEYMA